MEWAFLKSNRFWAAVIIALGEWLTTGDLSLQGVGKFLVVLGGLFVTIRTIDRAVEYVGTKK